MPTINYSLPIPAKHIEPNGLLPATPAASALWFFLLSAHGAIDQARRQVSYEGDQDLTVSLRELARGIGIAAGVRVEEMFESELWRRAQAEAKACELPMDIRVIIFINSGGSVNDIWERDPDAMSESTGFDDGED